MTSEQADSAPRSIERRIKSHYEEMPGSERALADRVLEYPGDVLLCSATELADLAGASKAAVSRFVRRLGYEGFKDMQREIREAQSTGDPIFLTAGLAPKQKQRDPLHQHLERDVHTLRETFARLDPEIVKDVVTRITAARRVVCIGFRNSYFFAAYARRQILLVHPSTDLVPSDGQTLIEDTGDLGPQDLLLVFGFRRRPLLLRKFMELMHGRGIPIAYFTDRQAVTNTKFAQWVLPCEVRGTSLFDSYVGVVSLINYICTQVSIASGNSGRQRLRQLEELGELLGELDAGN
ncbi:MurR/RpiR family transcriptional regulator [Rhizobium sp. RU36D]|uniref:MurR/RpiR family transcriptional regulator n=1 Tax=Rhizobium sp. RU36D TaxID=1907415 RepID=UPI0009D8F833|nr:MurR/RpiR family transcriptional regulator [Rhizobium sp. RU36D]SMC75814.1 transcriptional regulator, RpiR family [Rhizobium sp. RU36D]